MTDNLRVYTKKNLSSNFGFKISVTLQLIILNIIFFIIFKLLIAFNSNYLDYIALKPANFIHGKYFWTIFTSMFMHAGFLHLFFNMFSLFFIGNFVEKLLGKKRYFWFYLLAGIFAGLFFTLLSVYFGTNPFLGKIFGDPNIAGVGASGAIFGLLGFLALITPYARVYLIGGPLIAIVIEAVVENTIKSSAFLSVFSFLINFYFIISLFAIFSFNNKLSKIALPLEMPFWALPIIAIVPLIVIGLFIELPIGNMAHLGGLIAGLIYGIYIRKKYRKKTEMIKSYFR